MKKWLMVLVIGSAFTLSACGSITSDDQTSEDSQEGPETQEEEQYTPTEVTVDDIEIVNETTYAFIDTNSDIPYASYYAELKNNADVPVDLSASKIVYDDDADGRILAVTEMGIDYSPMIVPPGETAYVASYEPINPDEWPEGVYNANIELHPTESIVKTIEFPVENLNVSYNGRTDFAMIQATGKVVSDKDTNVTGYDLAVILYDKDNNFLGLLTGGSDDLEMKKGTTDTFQVENPPFPPDQMPNVANWKAVAYGIEF